MRGSARAARQQSDTLPTPAKRGDIVDRRGHLLATSVDVDSIYAVPSEIDNGAETVVRYVVDRFDGEIAALVTGTIARWDGEETARRLELLLGADLQYIRINGTVVGGLAGLGLHCIAQALS